MDAVLAGLALVAAGIIVALYLRHEDRKARRPSEPPYGASGATDGSDDDEREREEMQ